MAAVRLSDFLEQHHFPILNARRYRQKKKGCDICAIFKEKKTRTALFFSAVLKSTKRGNLYNLIWLSRPIFEVATKLTILTYFDSAHSLYKNLHHWFTLIIGKDWLVDKSRVFGRFCLYRVTLGFTSKSPGL